MTMNNIWAGMIIVLQIASSCLPWSYHYDLRVYCLYVGGGGGIIDSYAAVQDHYLFCIVGVSQDVLGSGSLHTADDTSTG